jgi:hypothetical protein
MSYSSMSNSPVIISMSSVIITHELNNLSRVLKCCDITDDIRGEICSIVEKRLNKYSSSKITDNEIAQCVLESVYCVVLKYPSKINSITLKFIVESYDKNWNDYKDI